MSASVAVFHTAYLPIYLSVVLGSTDQTIPIQQTTDRQYFNPT